MKSRLLVVTALALMSDLLQSAIPPSCYRVYSVLICSKLNFRLEQIFSVVMYEVIIDFVFINNTRTPCNCKVIELVKMLRVTDVITVTMSPCTLGRLVACEVDPVVPNPVVVAGLVVSRDDPRRHWAIKHHVKNVWFKIRSLEHADLRSFFSNSIIQDEREGRRNLYAQQSFGGELSAAKSIDVIDVVVTRKQFTEPQTTTETTTTATTTTTTTPTTSTTTTSARRRPPPARRRMVNRVYSKRRYGRRGYSYNKNDRYRQRGKRDGRRSYNKNDRYRQRGKRDDARVKTKMVNNLRFIESGDITDAYSNDSSPLTGVIPRRRKRQTWFASVVPYLAFAGGEYYSLYDTEGIKLGLPRSAQLPPLTAKSKPPKRNYPASKPAARGDAGAITAPTEIPTQPSGKYLSAGEIRRMTRESDHRMKSFIIFFVAITGIITVIAVLLIMAMKSTGDSRRKPRYTKLHANCPCCDQRRMEQESLLNDYEDTMHKRCPLFHFYEGAQQCPPNTCLMAQVMKQQVQDDGPTEKGTQTDGRCHPILGGRHVVTQFEAWCQDHSATYKPPGLNWSVGCGGQFVRDEDSKPAQQLPGMQSNVILPPKLETNRNVNRLTGSVTHMSPLVSFLDSIVTEKDGIMRKHHRDNFNVRRYRGRPQYQPCLHPHQPGSRRHASVPTVKKRQKSLLRTCSSSDTTEPESR